MKNKFIKSVDLKKQGYQHGCSRCYVLDYVYASGIDKLLFHSYIVFLYDLYNNKITYVYINHFPREKDVLELLSKSAIKENSCLFIHFKSPFTDKLVEGEFNSLFKYYSFYKNREYLGNARLCKLYLQDVLVGAMEQFGRGLDIKNGHVFEMPVQTINVMCYGWNSNFKGCFNLIVDKYSMYKDYYYLDSSCYEFNIEFKNEGNMLIIELWPKTLTAVNNKLLKSIYDIITDNNDKLCNPKMLLVSVYSENDWFTLSKSLMFRDDTSLEDFINHFEASIFDLKNKAYPIEVVDIVKLKLFRLPFQKGYLSSGVGKRSYSTSSVYNREIKPLKKRINPNLKLAVLDIETLPINGVHFPYAIGYMVGDSCKVFYLSDYGRNLKIANKKMMNEFFKNFLFDCKGYYVYVHNLGSFDGYLLLKELDSHVDGLRILVDKQNKFISIDLIDNKTNLRDSLRLLPASLDNLSKIFDVPIKKGYFDHSKVDKLSIFRDDIRSEVLKYLKKDLISLKDIIHSASSQLFEDYKIDFSKCYSASSLAMKIFRTNFQKHEIPMLPGFLDRNVRESYRGGATEVYKCHGYNLYYYDVNSLYPFAILNDMPYQYLGKKYNIDLSNFFGFVAAEIYCPDSVFNPFLPVKDFKSNNILYPYGYFHGTYFSEELKIAVAHGYIVKIKYGFEFSREKLFTDFVYHFYNKKLRSSGGSRFLHKLTLNSIYGYLGRQSKTLKSEIVSKKEAELLFLEFPIYEYTELNDDSVLIIRDTIPSTELQSFNGFRSETVDITYKTINNVAISSAITSYARSFMIPFKTDKDNPPLYTDTDSIFLNKPLPDKFIGNNLGQFKDELKGAIITEALFLAPKMYGYKTDKEEKVVMAGVKPGDLSFEELKSI